MRGREKRGHCDGCPATKRIVGVTYNGRRMLLCEACRLALSKMIREKHAAEDAKGAPAIVTANQAGDMDLMAADIEAALASEFAE